MESKQSVLEKLEQAKEILDDIELPAVYDYGFIDTCTNWVENPYLWFDQDKVVLDTLEKMITELRKQITKEELEKLESWKKQNKER